MNKRPIYGIAPFIAKSLCRLFLKKIDVKGEENIPERPSIIASNQTSDLDWFVLSYTFLKRTHRPITFVSKTHRDWRIPVSWYMGQLGCVMV